MLIPLWLVMVFVFGVAVGSFLNVCIARLPLEKSILWPGSRCGHCLQPIRWYDNLPLLSYLWLRGRCRVCRQRFSVRYFLVELITGLGFVGLFCLEVVLNVHDWTVPFRSPFNIEMGVFPYQWWVAFGFHAVLFSLLLAVSVCDLVSWEIPLQLPVAGTVIGLVGSVVLAWPWPYTGEQALAPVAAAAKAGAAPRGWWALPPGVGPRAALYPWPVWGPPPRWLEPGSWQMGLATGLAGALAGTLVLRAVAFLFGKGLGKEALGLGDADMMMMAGSFVGWQPVLVAFLVSPLLGVFFGVFRVLVFRSHSLPFGPSLAAGVLFVLLCWRWIGPHVQILFFWPEVLAAFAVLAGVFMLVSSFVVRMLWQVTGVAEETKDDAADHHR
jgi:leader peptidase (prepilin peptidase)/N-methyltransferase